MADFTPAKDRFSILDETAKWRQRNDSEERGGEEPWNPEERINVDTPYEHSRNAPSKRGGFRRDGGIGGVDWYKESGLHTGSADSEMMHLVGEYNSRPRSDNRTFNQWLNDEPIPGMEKKERFGVRIDLQQVGYDTELYEKVFLPLSKIWTDKKTEVKYIAGKDRDDDELVFRNKEAISVPVKVFNEVLEKQTLRSGERIRMRIRRPERENPKQFVTVLQNLRLGAGTFKGQGVAVESPEKPKAEKLEKKKEVPVDRNSFNQVLYQPALDRLTEGVMGIGKEEAERNKGAVKDFWGIWTHGPNEIDAVGFGVDEERTKITSVIMRLKDGTSITIPEHVFRKVFVVGRHEGKGGTGFEFIGGASLGRAFIDPHTPQYKLEDVMSKVRINGVKLPPNVRFFIGPYEKESPIPVELPKVSAYTTS